VYAAIGHGHFGVKVHRIRNGGADWEEVTTPAYPQRPADHEPQRCPVRGIEIPWNLEMIWALEPGAEPGIVWCGRIPGGLFQTQDRGDSWSLVRSLWDEPAQRQWFGGGYDYPGIHSIFPDPRDRSRLTVGVSCGGGHDGRR